MPSYTLPKVIWFKREVPEVYAAADAILQSNGYIAYKLTGRIHTGHVAGLRLALLRHAPGQVGQGHWRLSSA